MNINLKLQLVTIVPLVLALLAVLFVTQIQYESLSQQTVEEYRQSAMKHRKDVLRNYVTIAEGAIEHIYRNENLSLQEAQDAVKSLSLIHI